MTRDNWFVIVMGIIIIFAGSIWMATIIEEKNTNDNIISRIDKLEKHMEYVIDNQIKPIYNKGEQVFYPKYFKIYTISSIYYNYDREEFVYVLTGEDLFMKQVYSEDLLSIESFKAYMTTGIYKRSE